MARRMLKAMGLWTWDPRVPQHVYTAAAKVIWKGMGTPQDGTAFEACQRLLVLDCAGAETADLAEAKAGDRAAVDAFLLACLEGMDANCQTRLCQVCGCADAAALLATVLLEQATQPPRGLGATSLPRGGLGEAAQAAAAALRFSPKPTARWEAHVVLGRLAVGKDDLGAAEAAMEQAALEAKNASAVCLEVRALGLLREQVLEPQGRGLEATKRLEALARERLGGKALADLQELLGPAPLDS